MIKGLSETRRLPRIGKISLGLPPDDQHKYPRDVKHFVCPPEVQKIYGAEPMELDVLIPVEDPEFFFPHYYKRYGGNRVLQCRGDGNTAMTMNIVEIKSKKKADKIIRKKQMVEVSCPCPALDEKECVPKANLAVILPRVNMGGVYQIDTGSVFGIIQINSAIDYIRGCFGKVSWIPLKLVRVPRDINFEGKHTIKHIIDLRWAGDINEMRRLRASDAGLLSAPQKQIAAPAMPEPEEDFEIENVGDEPDAVNETPPPPPSSPPPPVTKDAELVDSPPASKSQRDSIKKLATRFPSKKDLIVAAANDAKLSQKRAAELMVSLQPPKNKCPEWLENYGAQDAVPAESEVKVKLRGMVTDLGDNYTVNEKEFAELNDETAQDWVDNFDPMGCSFVNVKPIKEQ